MVTLMRIWAVGALAGLVGCRHSPPPVGQGAFAFVAPTVRDEKIERAPESLSLGETVMAAEPILPLAVPVYPKAALAKRPGQVTVGVRITIDTQGRVSEIGSSMAVFSTPNSYGAGFRESVEAAVKEWRFQPAVIQHTAPGKGADGRDVLVFRDAEKTEWAFDVAFTFTASGDVLTGLPGIESRAAEGRGWRAFFVRLFRPRVLRSESP